MATTVITATVGKVLQVAGGNLFAIASRELGDATQWNRIARLNQLWDPFLPEGQVVSLKIPPVDPKAGNGGILGA